MTFIYILGSGSKYDNAEIRYSIRSVVKFHPDARIIIVGEKPSWYTGEHHYVADANECPYVNQWAKLEFACTLTDEFVYMDDDFYLLRAFTPSFYTPGTLWQKVRAVSSLAGHWAEVVKSTYNELGDCLSFLQHAPLPINSAEFLEIAENYPNRLKAPSLIPRQIYCYNSEYCEVKDKPDMKIRGRFKPKDISDYPFFSIADRFHKQADSLQALYPEPSEYEISKRLESDDKPQQTDMNYETES
jgi:hypothetical protein